ncbi:MAG: hypothetical protein Q9226_002605 [Calogaya cf. arnoldii]
MHFSTPVLVSAAIFFSATYSAPAFGIGATQCLAGLTGNGGVICGGDKENPPDDGQKEANDWQRVCSADTSTSAPEAYAQDPLWKEQMKACLVKLNADTWNVPGQRAFDPANCEPQKPDGTPLGEDRIDV